MVMLDQLDFCQGEVAQGRLRIVEDNVFMEGGLFSESGMIEAIAQTAAARTGYLARQTGNGKKEDPPIGVIGSVKDFELFFRPELGDEVIVEIRVMHEVMNASVIEGRVTVNDRMACKAELKIFITGKNLNAQP